MAPGDPHAWYPASVPFPAASLAGFDITAHGKVLVIIPLRPGTMSASTQAAADQLMPGRWRQLAGPLTLATRR